MSTLFDMKPKYFIDVIRAAEQARGNDVDTTKVARRFGVC